jgi:hypothetical protein
MITRHEAISTIDSVLQEAARRVTKPLRPEAVAAFRAESLAAYDSNPERFPTAGILAKYVRFRTSARLPAETQAQADPPAGKKRRRMPACANKPILEEMSPSGENALRRWEGE